MKLKDGYMIVEFLIKKISLSYDSIEISKDCKTKSEHLTFLVDSVGELKGSRHVWWKQNGEFIGFSILQSYERDKLNKYGRPLLGCTIKPKLGLSAKNGRA